MDMNKLANESAALYFLPPLDHLSEKHEKRASKKQ